MVRLAGGFGGSCAQAGAENATNNGKIIIRFIWTSIAYGYGPSQTEVRSSPLPRKGYHAPHDCGRRMRMGGQEGSRPSDSLSLTGPEKHGAISLFRQPGTA